MTLSASPAEAPTAIRWRIIALLMVGSFLSWFNRVSMSVAGTEKIIGQYGIDETQMGMVYSALLLAYALAMTPGGFLIDRIGARAALVLMSVGTGLFVVLTGAVGWLFATAASVWLALMIVRPLVGIFAAPVYPASGRIISHWLPLPRRAWANALVNAAASLGSAGTFFGFGLLMDWFDWPMAFALTGLATVLVGLVWMLYARDRPEQHPAVNAAEREIIAGTDSDRSLDPLRSEKATTRRSGGMGLLNNRSLLLLTVSYGSVSYFEYLFYFWSQYYFESVLHLPKAQSRFYATILNLAMAAGIVLGGLLSERMLRVWGYRWGRAVVPLCGMVFSAALLPIGIAAREPAAIVFFFSLAVAFVGACEGPCWATAIELGGRRGGASGGIFNTGGNIGGLIAPTLTPWVSRHFGWGWGIALGSIACLLGAGLWLGIDAGERVGEEKMRESVNS